jgi:hypothetical protein
MKDLTVAFFEDLYMVGHEVNPHQVLSLVELRVSQGMHEELSKEFLDKEISDALFQMGPLKAPGPDVFPVRFYKNTGAL